MAETPSFEAIDYRLRPAKYAERLMVAEFASRSRFHNLTHYQYVGMGSVHFTDFKLFHRSLGITRLTSIEGSSVQDRFLFNKPFNHITLSFGTTGEVLPGLDWAVPAIVWLDYDGQISQDKLQDVDFLVRKVPSGSLLFFSINAEKPAPKGMPKEERDADLVAALKKMVDPSGVPSDVKHRDLQGKQARSVYFRLMNQAIEAALASFNAKAELNGEPRKCWHQLMHLTYKDGALMLTIGGVIYDETDSDKLEASAFNLLPTYRNGSDTVHINVPKLTVKEMNELEKVVAQDPTLCAELPWLPSDDRTSFMTFHRYLPNFVAAEY